MTLEPYSGHCPSNIGKDAKYSMSAAGEVRLTYHIDSRTRDLLTTDGHPTLAKMVIVLPATGAVRLVSVVA